MKSPSTLGFASAILAASAAAHETGSISSAPMPVAQVVPDGLTPGDWASIREAYVARRHQALGGDGGYRARNPGQQWTTIFDGRGFSTTPDAGSWRWGLELAAYGWGETLHDVVQPQSSSAEGGRVVYAWDARLTEWYVNDTRGLEHGYTVSERPQEANGPLLLSLAIRGVLAPEVSENGREVLFLDAQGCARLAYAGLVVLDADGRALAAGWEQVASGLRLRVDDRDACYPLTIDPIAQQVYLKASNTELGDGFGGRIAISGDTVVVGAYDEDSNATGVNGNQSNNSASQSGAVYVFVRNQASWSQQAYLKASNTAANDDFSLALAVDGDTIVVGAAREDSNATGVNGPQNNNLASASGAAYVFVRNGATWSQQAYLKASNTGSGERFGTSVSVSGDTIVVGADGEDSNATGVNGDQNNNLASGSGAAYAFVRNGTTWSQEAYLKASNTESGDHFGGHVSVYGDTIVVGAAAEASNATGVNGDQNNNLAFGSGAAYVFVRNGTTWSQEAYLKASNTELGDSFGDSVSISGDKIAVGAYQEDSHVTGVNGNGNDNLAFGSGAAYVFVRNGTTWSQEAYLKASNTEVNDEFGRSVSVSGDTVVVGAFHEDSDSTGVNGAQNNNLANESGAAYVFVRNGAGWSQKGYLKASNTGTNDEFGLAVSISDYTIAVGAPGEYSSATGVNGNQEDNSAPSSGAAYVFDLFASVAYCTAGTSAAGCQAAISSTGTASASAPSGFSLLAANVEAQKDGLFFFGTNGQQANPWGNGTSYQCVVPPLTRASLLSGSGTPGACDGSLAQDLNALWCSNCPKAGKNPGAGALVQAQLWYRDPLNTSNQTTSFSNAIEFSVAP